MRASILFTLYPPSLHKAITMKEPWFSFFVITIKELWHQVLIVIYIYIYIPSNEDLLSVLDVSLFPSMSITLPVFNSEATFNPPPWGELLFELGCETGSVNPKNKNESLKPKIKNSNENLF